eukprot:scaffold72096_cov54-Phaeocystis_antarctica.AAC.2
MVGIFAIVLEGVAPAKVEAFAQCTARQARASRSSGGHWPRVTWALSGLPGTHGRGRARLGGTGCLRRCGRCRFTIRCHLTKMPPHLRGTTDTCNAAGTPHNAAFYETKLSTKLSTTMLPSTLVAEFGCGARLRSSTLKPFFFPFYKQLLCRALPFVKLNTPPWHSADEPAPYVTTQLFVTSTNYHRVFVRRRALAANTTTRSALTALQTMKVPHLGAAMDPALASFANTSQVGQARILAKL